MLDTRAFQKGHATLFCGMSMSLRALMSSPTITYPNTFRMLTGDFYKSATEPRTYEEYKWFRHEKAVYEQIPQPK